MKWRTFAIALSIIGSFLLVAGYATYRVLLAPPSESTTEEMFVVVSGESAPTIAKHLKEAGLIKSPTAFVTYLNLHGLRADIKAGSYSLSPNLSAGEIAEIMADGKVTTKRLVIPEGTTLAKIIDLAADQGVDAQAMRFALASPHYQAFLSSKPANVDLEGYLFPDTYQIGATTSAADLVNAMLDTFGQRVTDQYVAELSAQGLTLHQGLTIASIVEREVNKAEDRPIVAQIFLKRYRMGMPLGSDVTVHYAADLAGKPFDLSIDSPYNTRKYAGLPPGPICSPSLQSIEAVMKPAKTDYLYFLTGKDGKDYFAKTYDEHQRNIAKYLR